MVYEILLILYFVGCLAGLWLVLKKAGEKPWKALIPVYNIIVWMRICGKDTKEKKWKWYIAFLIPAINIFMFLLLVVETANVFHRYNYFEQTFAVIFPWIYLPYVGLNKYQYYDPHQEEPHQVSQARDWLDAITFAIVAAVIIRSMMFEFYNIPSSSMEKSLMTGDYLVVSKMAYGPRSAMTPLSVPLLHNVLPLTDGQVESYLKWIKLPYHRYKGFKHVERFDPVVFNYPDGDTMCTAWKSNRSYHSLVREMGRENVLNAKMLPVGNQMVTNHIRVRPVDKRENFIKRCIGLPGEDLQIIDQKVYINGNEIATPPYSQQTYKVMFKEGINTRKVLDDIGVSHEDYSTALSYMMYSGMPYYQIPLTEAQVKTLEARPDIIEVVPDINKAEDGDLEIFPHSERYKWSTDNFGPVHIPAKGETLKLTIENLPIYTRVIEIYEGNTLEVKGDKIFINGQEATEYTCKMDYYWMMGDNRHNSVDSRYWGFVPEDHISGKATMVLFSWDKDHGKPRWNRVFKSARSME
jgi:signal peptidase I